jgi:hypothetical protein
MGSKHINQTLSSYVSSGDTERSSFANFDPGVERIYVNCIPEFVEQTLVRLYENVFCTLARIDAYESLKGVSTYVRLDDSVIRTIILFRNDGRTINVVTQQVKLTQNEINSFARLVFLNYPVTAIKFHALDSRLLSCPYPFLQRQVLEENIILLPQSKDAYLSKLRPQFRKQVLMQEKAIRIRYPDFKIKILSRGQINGKIIDKLLSLASERMASKGARDYTSTINREALQKIFERYGYVAIGTIGEEICGGAMWLGVGTRHFHQIAAHNPKYDEFTLGTQLWMAAILHCIEIGGAECWLMGGANLHKAKFLAKPHALNGMTLFRSKAHASLDFPLFVKHWYQNSLIYIKNWIRSKVPFSELSRKSNVSIKRFFNGRH